MEKEIRNPTFAFSLLFLSPSLSFALSSDPLCSPLSNMPSGTRNAPFKAPIPRFKLFPKRSVSGTMLTRPVQGMTRVVFLCVCEVESCVVSAVEQRLIRPVQGLIRVVSRFVDSSSISLESCKIRANSQQYHILQIFNVIDAIWWFKTQIFGMKIGRFYR